MRHLPALLGVLLLFGAIFVVRREFHSLKLEDIETSLSRIPPRALLISLVWTVLSYGVLTLYDRLGTIYAGQKVSYRRVAMASFCAYALSHNLGFAAVSGAAVRYRLYAHWGLAPLQIAKVVAFCSLTFGLGGMVLGGTILLVEPGAVPFFGPLLPHWALYLLAALMWGIVAGYITLSRVLGSVRLFGHPITLPGWRMAILQVLLASLDVAVTASIFYALLPHVPGLTPRRFLAVYLASYTAGLAANLPGGIGVFDSAMLLGLSDYLDPPQIVGAILVFRLYYYIIPLFLAGGLFTGNEILLRGGTLFRALRRSAQRPAGAVRFSEPDFAIAAATGLVTMCGALLLSLGVLLPQPDLSWVDPDLAGVAAGASVFIPSLIGACLMVLAIGLSQRVTLAWGTTILLLILAAGITLARGEHLWVPLVLVLATVLIAPFRSAFYRHARLITGPLQAETAVPLFALVVCVLALAVFDRRLQDLPDTSWLAVLVSPTASDSLRLSVGLSVVVALVAIWRLMRPGRVEFLPWGQVARLRYAALGAVPPAQADGLVLGEGERSAIAFCRVRGVLLGLGDPVGVPAERASAIWRLADLARQEGLDAAVWLAGHDLLKIYGDLGLSALPLDAQGMPARSVPQDGAAPDTLAPHYLCCIAERDLDRLLPLLPAIAAAADLRPAAE